MLGAGRVRHATRGTEDVFSHAPNVFLQHATLPTVIQPNVFHTYLKCGRPRPLPRQAPISQVGSSLG